MVNENRVAAGVPDVLMLGWSPKLGEGPAGIFNEVVVAAVEAGNELVGRYRRVADPTLGINPDDGTPVFKPPEDIVDVGPGDPGKPGQLIAGEGISA
jgi:hypothetical protein